jgi:hypothetical protein
VIAAAHSQQNRTDKPSLTELWSSGEVTVCVFKADFLSSRKGARREIAGPSWAKFRNTETSPEVRSLLPRIVVSRQHNVGSQVKVTQYLRQKGARRDLES